MDLPRRKLNRLQNYDYSTNGIYFVTVCSYKKLELFSKISNDSIVNLTDIGELIDSHIHLIPTKNTGVNIHNYVIMPNHIHILMELSNATKSIPAIINQFKGSVSKKVKFTVWQKSYHDHIIRNSKEYEAINCYIDQNPERWFKDCYYCVGNGDLPFHEKNNL